MFDQTKMTILKDLGIHPLGLDRKGMPVNAHVTIFSYNGGPAKLSVRLMGMGWSDTAVKVDLQTAELLAMVLPEAIHALRPKQMELAEAKKHTRRAKKSAA